LEAVEERLYQFQKRYEQIAKPFEWKFTREDLLRMIEKLNNRQSDLALSA